MAASGDVTFTQDSAKFHPYLLAVVRWCVECLWSSLHRLMTAPLPPIAASKPAKRPASHDHLDPVPRVECVVLHKPEAHIVDVIFVHGLYGSLGNTWRQGEWTSKYQRPETVHLSRPSSLLRPCACHQCAKNQNDYDEHLMNDEKIAINEVENDRTKNSDENRNIFDDKSNDNSEADVKSNIFSNIDEKFKIIPQDEVFITERFYDDTLLNVNQVEIVDNYETQAKFVSDLFKKRCDSYCDEKYVDIYNDSVHLKKTVENDNNKSYNDNIIYNFDKNTSYDEANLFDDVKNSSNNNEVAYKTIENSYNAVENSLNNNKKSEKNFFDKSPGHVGIDCKCKGNEKQCEVGCGCICDECYSPCWPRDWIKVDFPEARVISINYTSDPHLWRPLWIKENKRLHLNERAEQMTQQLIDLGVGQRPVVWVGHSKGGLFIKQIYCEAYKAYLKTKESATEQNTTELFKDNEKNISKDIENQNNEDLGENDQINHEGSENNNVKNENAVENAKGNKIEHPNHEEIPVVVRNEETRTSNNEEIVSRISSLWTNSVGFMFYSVPHRGAPLADIKTPITARSVELLEISKDCSLVLSLQERWLRAASTSPCRPLVRSLVETRRTFMSVLWLRIVSAQSADPGIGPVCGVALDHREICKPSSRQCMLYTELAALIRTCVKNNNHKLPLRNV